MKNLSEHRISRALLLSSGGLILLGVLSAGLVRLVFWDSSPQWKEMGAFLWGAVGAALGYFIPLLIASRRTQQGLESFGSNDEQDQETLEKLQTLPYFTSRLMFLFWCVWACLFSIEQWFFGEKDPFLVVMIGAGAMVLAVAASLLITAWHKRILGATLLHIQTGHAHLMAASVSRRYSIRFQVARALVGLIFFACGVSLLVTMSQQQNLVLQVVSDQMHHELDRLLVGSSPSLVKECKAMGNRPSRSEMLVIQNEAVVCTTSNSFGESVEKGSWERLVSGPVSLDGGEIVGWSEPLESGGGWVLLVTPKPSELRSSVRLLLVFFTILFVFSAGLVSVVSRDLTTPVLDLTRRVREFSKNESAHIPPRIPVRDDELGELTLAFERMRESLAERIRLIEEMNRSLESTVEERTRELKESQEQLLRTEKMASLGQLVAGVAHEVNNPLNAVLNNINPLLERLAGMEVEAKDDPRKTGDLADMRSMLGLIEEGAGRTARIVEALRVFSHPGTFEVAPVSVSARFEVAVNLLRHRMSPALRIEREGGEDAKVLCDLNSLDQILLNLLTNALDAVAGESQPRIRLGSQICEDGMEIFVEDNGQGVSEENRARIFDPFFTTKEVGQGTGLGLSIVHTLVDRHGGYLRVEPAQEKGTVFTVVLPVFEQI